MYKQPYLIQRLEPSRDFNPFSFGGGLLNGGLSPDAMSIIKGIFSFDYMGAAEFEWGAIPKSLGYIAKNHTEYVSHTLTCKTKEKNNSDVYVICQFQDFESISDWLTTKLFDEYATHTKEHVGLQDAINKEQKRRVCGWLDIENHFFFFINKEMFENVKKLFEIA